LWRMTQSLRDIGMDTDARFPRLASGVSYQAGADCMVDVDVMRAAMAVVRATDPAQAGPADVARVEAAVTAYRGDLLEAVYADWCLLWRESLRAQHFEALDFLREAAMARQDWAGGLRYGRMLLALDPLQEHVHRAVMRCHFHNGDRPLAMRQYAVCEQVLREELGVEPMDETRRIQQTILAVPAKPVVSADPVPRRRSDTSRSPVQKVDMALSNLNTARNWLEEVSSDLRQQG
jgi:DNA-binding SARP family transcriptional activator